MSISQCVSMLLLILQEFTLLVNFWAYCFIRLSSRKAVSANGILTCPQCNCIASNINHHQPIRLDDGLTYFRNTPQVVLGRSEGHHCVICFEDFNIRDADLGTMDTEENCRHIFGWYVAYLSNTSRISTFPQDVSAQGARGSGDTI